MQSLWTDSVMSCGRRDLCCYYYCCVLMQGVTWCARDLNHFCDNCHCLALVLNTGQFVNELMSIP